MTASRSGPKVTIRIEGAKRTLLATTTVPVPASGSITKGGVASGLCPADSAAGVLNAATKGSWSGSWEGPKYNDYFVTTILGDTESGSKSFFSFLVNDVPAASGPCEVKLKAGDQVLFGAVPLSGEGYPLLIKAPRTARKGASFKVTVDAFNASGKPAPLAGASVSGGGTKATTNAKGLVMVNPRHAGKLTLGATKAGDIRAATVTVRVARPAAAREARAPGSPLGYLLAAQNRDGGFGSAPGQPSTPLYSAWVALALEAARRNPTAVSNGGPSLLAYMEANLGSDPGSIDRAILVAHAAGVAPTDFGGHDLLAALQHEIRRNGSIADEGDLTVFGVLALRAVGVRPPARMLQWLVRQQNGDGGFSYKTKGVLADVDDTGAALEALAGSAPTACRRAVAYLRAAQNRDGGFPNEPGGASNAQSTSWAVQGLVSDHVNPARVTTHRSPSPVRFLGSLITRSGAVDYSRGLALTPVWVTAEAIPALARKPFPLAPAPA